MIEKSPYSYVDPLIDTGKPKIRWVFFQSASLPFGMVQLSPDTDIKGTWGVGYRYYSKRIKCFSHIHQWQLSGIAILPILNNKYYKDGYKFSHKNEIVKPGYHKVHLKECDITAQLTSTYRVGFHQYTFNRKGTKSIRIDLKNQLGPCEMNTSKVTIINEYSINGFVENAKTSRRPKPCKIFFHIICNQKFKLEDTNDIYFLKILNSNNNIVKLKVAISFVSTSNAKLNMLKELNHFNFNKTLTEAKNIWENHLNKITVKSKNRKYLVKFYTDLWRITMGGHIISDVNFEYLDMTHQNPIKRKTNGYNFISNADIFWGAHWSLSQIYDLFYPKIKSDYCKSQIEFSNFGGYVPRGATGGNYTYVMIAAHCGSFIISAFFKGINDFDIDQAYKGIKSNAFLGGLMSKSGYEHNSCFDGGIEEYIQNGYIPIRKRKSKGGHCDSASMTVEYCYDDWCLSNFAKSLGKMEDYKYFKKRSENYINLFDKKTKFIRPKDNDGKFSNNFDPRSKFEFCEGNSWSYTYYVPHNIENIINLTGGNKKFNKKLNYAFNKSKLKRYYAKKTKTKRDKAYINYGNENMRFTASLFNYSNANWLSQKWTRKVKLALFSGIGKNCFKEDDDCGLSAGTSILLGLGLFDLKGGSYENPIYDITSPIFDEITINLDNTYYNGNKLIVKTYNNSKKNMFIKKILFNNIEITNYKITHNQLVSGGVLEIFLSNKPIKKHF